MYKCENWTTIKAEWQRIDAFELWGWRRFLRVPWTARRSNQSILKEINPEYSLEVLVLKLRLQYFGHLMWTAESLVLGHTEGMRRGGNRDDIWWHHWLREHEFEQLWERVKDREAWHAAVHGITKSRTPLSDGTTATNEEFSSWRMNWFSTPNLPLSKSAGRPCGQNSMQTKIRRNRQIWWWIWPPILMVNSDYFPFFPLKTFMAEQNI